MPTNWNNKGLIPPLTIYAVYLPWLTVTANSNDTELNPPLTNYAGNPHRLTVTAKRNNITLIPPFKILTSIAGFANGESKSALGKAEI